MKKLILGTFAALALSVTASFAQLTYSNLPFASGLRANTDSDTSLQTFTGFGGLDSVTWHLNGSSGQIGLTTYIAEWDTANSRAVSGTVFQYGGAEQITSSTGNFDLIFNQSITLDASATYALILAKTTNFVGGANIATRKAPDQPANSFFGSGNAYVYIGTPGVAGASFFSTYITSTTADFNVPGDDMLMTISGTVGPVTPIPEPKTAAAAFAGLFAAGLFLRRNGWQKRRAALAAAA